jgi:hypothetical protein
MNMTLVSIVDGALLQLGVFVSFHPLIAPTVIGLGIFGLTYWFISDNVLPFIIREPLSLGSEVVITTPISIGAILVMYGVTAEANIFWVFIVLVGLMGKVIQGGITIYAVRKLLSYAQSAKSGVEKRVTSTASDDESVPFRTQAKLKAYTKGVHILSRLLLFCGVVGISIVIVHAMYRLPLAIAIDWSLIVGVGTLLTLLSNTRNIRHDVGIPAVVGIVFCVVGTEVYEYPASYVPMVNQIFETVSQTSSLGVLGFNLAPIEIVVILVSPVAYVLGLVLAIACWKWAPAPDRTAFSATYRT